MKKQVNFLSDLWGMEKLFEDYLEQRVVDQFPEIERVSEISVNEFQRKYVEGSKPVVITNGTTDWKAMEQWNHNFFKKIAGMLQSSNRYITLRFVQTPPLVRLFSKFRMGLMWSIFRNGGWKRIFLQCGTFFRFPLTFVTTGIRRFLKNYLCICGLVLKMRSHLSIKTGWVLMFGPHRFPVVNVGSCVIWIPRFPSELTATLTSINS